MKLGNEFFGLLGLATKAGQMRFGAFQVESGVKKGKVFLVLMDCALSPRSAKGYRDLCAHYQVPLIEISPAGELARRCGRQENKIAGVAQKAFAERLLAITNENANNAEV